jgi:DNA repair ATPase RecN
MNLAVAKNRLEALERQLAVRKAEQELLIKEKEEAQRKVDDFAALKLELEKTNTLLVQTADASREAGRKRMEKVVTRALQHVFGPDFRFEIELTDVGGKPAAKFWVVTTGENGEEVRNDPQESRGGGVNDIIAIALQVATMVVYNSPKIQGPIILDEPGKHVSEEYVVKFGEFLEFISNSFNRQIIMVTHQPVLAATANKTFISKLVGGKTQIKTADLSQYKLLDLEDDDDEQSEDDTDTES